MTKSKTTITQRKRLMTKSLGLSEGVLKLFPKTSRMGKADPSQWEMAGNRKVRLFDRAVTGPMNDYQEQ